MPTATEKMRYEGRCPYCSTMSPELTKIYNRAAQKNSFGFVIQWTGYECAVCKGVILCKGLPGQTGPEFLIDEFIPSSKNAPDELPQNARVYLQQALEAQGQPDLAAMGAASSIDAMLKAKGLKEGTLNQRINKAVEEKILTQDMADWAHAIRLSANDPRHADEENSHINPEISRQMLEFAETLGLVLFVLPARIKKNLEGESGG